MGVVFNMGIRIVLPNGDKIVPSGSYNYIAQNARKLKLDGFSAVQFMPSTYAEGGAYPDVDGYGKQLDWHWGTENDPTRYGYDEEIRRATSMCDRVGLDCYTDFVMHQYMGGDWSKTTPYPEPMFPKFPWCFVGNPPCVEVDPVFDSNGNFGFGDMVSVVNSGHNQYMLVRLIESMQASVKCFGWRGCRLDDVKGFAVVGTRSMTYAMKELGLYVFGECFTGTVSELQYLISLCENQLALLDFTTHFDDCVNACNSNNANAMTTYSIANQNGPLAMTFRDNGDTDTTNGEQVIQNGLIANDRILTKPGYPSVYAKDYLPFEQSGYNLANLGLLNSIWIHENLAFGDEVKRYSDNNIAVFERLGYPGLLTIFNFDVINSHGVWVETNFGPNVELQDYKGRGENIWTNSDGWVYVEISPNSWNKGQNTRCYSRVGYTQAFSTSERYSTHYFYGDKKLTWGGAKPNIATVVGAFWTDLGYTCTLDVISGSNSLKFTILDPNNEVLENCSKATVRGRHTIVVFNSSPIEEHYEVSITYMGMAELLDSEMKTPVTFGLLPGQSTSKERQAQIQFRLAKRKVFYVSK